MSENKVPEVGEFLYSSWGYDQTNIEFYKVVRASESSVWLQEWESEISGVAGWASEYVVPGKKAKVASVYEWDENNVRRSVSKGDVPVVRKKWSKYGGVIFSSYKAAWLWDGSPKYASHYA